MLFKRIYNSLAFRFKRAAGLHSSLQYHVISREPLILIAYNHLETLTPLLRGRQAHLFVGKFWTWEAPDQIEDAKRLLAQAQASRCFDVTFLSNSEREAEVAASHGIDSIVVSHNAFLDERLFDIRPGVARKYRAIYDGRLTFFKRHELAERVRDLALITYTLGLNDSPEYTARVKEMFHDAAWLNRREDGTWKTLSANEVAVALNESRVGLILSKMEGGNYASAQYLLCGLPVVSTRSIGGRDAFFEAPHVEIVEDDPAAVAAAVDKLISLNLDPNQIRRRTLEMMQPHRDRFITAVQAIYDRAQVKRDFRSEWPHVFSNKMIGYHSRRELARLLHG